MKADGRGSGADILEGLNHVASQCHDRKCVINMSLGGGQPEPGPMHTAIEQASKAIPMVPVTAPTLWRS